MNTTLKILLKSGFSNAVAQGFYRAAILLAVAIYSSHSNNVAAFAVETSLMTMLVTMQSLGAAGLSQAANIFLSSAKSGAEYSANFLGILLLSVLLSFTFSQLLWFDTLLISFNEQWMVVFLENKKILMLSVFALCQSAVFRGFLQSKFQYQQLAFTSIVAAVTILLCINDVVGELSLLESYVISVAVEFFFLVLFVLLAFGKSAFQSAGREIPFLKLLRFTIPAMLNGLFLMPVGVIVILLLSKFSSMQELASYNVGMQVRNAIVFIPVAFLPVLLTHFSKTSTEDVKKSAVNSLIGSVAFSALLVLFVSFLKLLAIPPLHVLSWVDVISVGLASILFCYNSVIGTLLAVELKSFLGLFFNASWAVVNLLFSYVFIAGYGFRSGGLLALAVSYSYLTIVQTVYFRKSHA